MIDSTNISKLMKIEALVGELKVGLCFAKHLSAGRLRKIEKLAYELRKKYATNDKDKKD